MCNVLNNDIILTKEYEIIRVTEIIGKCHGITSTSKGKYFKLAVGLELENVRSTHKVIPLLEEINTKSMQDIENHLCLH